MVMIEITQTLLRLNRRFKALKIPFKVKKHKRNTAISTKGAAIVTKDFSMIFDEFAFLNSLRKQSYDMII